MNDAIQGSKPLYSNDRAVILAGGVGGARAARSLASVFPGDQLTVIGNVGDDDMIHGVHVSADLDTIVYTLAGIEGPHGWGIAGDTFTVMDHLGSFGADTSFRLGDRDLAQCLHRTMLLRDGVALSTATERLCSSLGVAPTVIPATDDAVRTRVGISDGTWIAFQEYFVSRGHRDRVVALEYAGAERSRPAPGVIDALVEADVIVIAPSNPPLSIEPILAVPGIRQAVTSGERVVAISPLFGGKALKGPADRVMASLGSPPGNAGVLAGYSGLITDLVVDVGDVEDVARLAGSVQIHATDTRLGETGQALRFAGWFAEVFT